MGNDGCHWWEMPGFWSASDGHDSVHIGESRLATHMAHYVRCELLFFTKGDRISQQFSGSFWERVKISGAFFLGG